ncbi:MAG TPA: hypothetical protein VKR43_24055 [Bryobacteraceae bacterium]|nr:hypothetical protein [Bryobacteraceae bacterium]
MTRYLASIVFAAVAFGQLPATVQNQLETADRQILRLNPVAFRELPKNLSAELERRGCTIPQVPMIAGPHNVIQGEFAKPGQKDWAALCSVNRVSSILVFWNGSEVRPAEIEKMKDIDRLQSWTDQQMVYSRAITATDEKNIMKYYNAFGGEKPPPIDHQGIDDAFVGKASVIRYFYRGAWLHLTGAD